MHRAGSCRVVESLDHRRCPTARKITDDRLDAYASCQRRSARRRRVGVRLHSARAGGIPDLGDDSAGEQRTVRGSDRSNQVRLIDNSVRETGGPSVRSVGDAAGGGDATASTTVTSRSGRSPTTFTVGTATLQSVASALCRPWPSNAQPPSRVSPPGDRSTGAASAVQTAAVLGPAASSPLGWIANRPVTVTTARMNTTSRRGRSTEAIVADGDADEGCTGQSYGWALSVNLARRRPARPQITTTALPPTVFASRSRWACTMSSSRYSWPMGAVAMPASKASMNPWRTCDGRSLASPE